MQNTQLHNLTFSLLLFGKIRISKIWWALNILLALACSKTRLFQVCWSRILGTFQRIAYAIVLKGGRDSRKHVIPQRNGQEVFCSSALLLSLLDNLETLWKTTWLDKKIHPCCKTYTCIINWIWLLLSSWLPWMQLANEWLFDIIWERINKIPWWNGLENSWKYK